MVLAVALTVIAAAHLLGAQPLPIASQAFPDSAEYADSAQHLADHDGFVTFVHGPVAEAPRYPPGLPLTLAPFALIGGAYPHGAQDGAVVLGLAYVLAVIAAAWLIGGPLSAALAAIVVTISPFARQNAQQILSDGYVATLSVLLLPLLHYRRTPQGDRLGGALAGLMAIVRLVSGIGLIAYLGAYRLRGGLRGAVRILGFAIPFLIVLALIQWMYYGDPFFTGYDYWHTGFAQTFNLANVFGAHTSREGGVFFADKLNGSLMSFTCPCDVSSFYKLSNFWFYPAVLLGGFWVYSPPFLSLIGLWWAWRIRRTPLGRYAWILVVLHVVVMDFYFFQAARFMAAPASVLLVLSCVGAAEGLERAAAAVRRRMAAPRGSPAV